MLPHAAISAVIRVIDFGARKHVANGWRSIPDYRAHFGAKMARHAASWISGDPCDKETGESHLAHLVADALFILDRDIAAKLRAEDDTKEAP